MSIIPADNLKLLIELYESGEDLETIGIRFRRTGEAVRRAARVHGGVWSKLIRTINIDRNKEKASRAVSNG